MKEAFSYTPPTPSFAKSSNAYLPRKAGQKTFAIGDIHGDLPKLLMALMSAKLITQTPSSTSDEDVTLSDFKWSGGDSVLVQVGDILDRGSFECACLHLLATLSHQAAEEGGGVVFCLGNHEVLNALGLFNYADKEGNTEFESIFGGYFDHVEEGGEVSDGQGA
jgi:hypothetical protein